MNGPFAGQNKESGSSLVEMCLWSFLIVITVIAFERGFLRRYRGFKIAVSEQARPLNP